MDRARRAGWTVLIVVAMVVMLEGGGGGRAIAVRAGLAAVHARGLGGPDRRCLRVGRVRRARQPGRAAVDLQGLEVVYATSTGSTVTRKATWTGPTILDPGRRILIANAAGLLRRARRCHLLGWFRGHRRRGRAARRRRGGDRCGRLGRRDERVRRGQRGSGAAAGSSLERRPGGAAATAPTPTTTSPTGSCRGRRRRRASGRRRCRVRSRRRARRQRARRRRRRPSRRARRQRRRRRRPTPTPSPTADADRRRRRRPPTPDRRRRPRPPRRPRRPRRTSTPTPDPDARRPRPTPSQPPIAIAEARTMPDGATVTIEGVLTTALGALESGHGGFIQDASGGIALYLDGAVVGELAGGQHDHGRGLTVESIFTANAADLGDGYQAGTTGRPAGRDRSGDRSRRRGSRGPARVRHRHRRRIARPADGRARRSRSTTDPVRSARSSGRMPSAARRSRPGWWRR